MECLEISESVLIVKFIFLFLGKISDLQHSKG